MVPQIDRDANAAWLEYQAAEKRTHEDRNLSPEGKAQQSARNRAAYAAKVEQLRGQGKLQTDSDRRTAQLAMKFAVSREWVELRADAGDVVAADIIRRKLEAAPGAEIKAIYEAVKDDKWLRAVVSGYGVLAIEARAGEKPTADDIGALDALRPKRSESERSYENRVYELRPQAVEQWLADLDRGQRARTFADKFGVSAAHVPLPDAG